MAQKEKVKQLQTMLKDLVKFCRNQEIPMFYAFYDTKYHWDFLPAEQFHKDISQITKKRDALPLFVKNMEEQEESL